MTDTIALLKNVAIFKDLDDSEFAEISEVCREEKFISGEYIFREGESGNRLYLICEGEVRISRDVPGSGEEALAILKPAPCLERWPSSIAASARRTPSPMAARPY